MTCSVHVMKRKESVVFMRFPQKTTDRNPEIIAVLACPYSSRIKKAVVLFIRFIVWLTFMYVQTKLLSLTYPQNMFVVQTVTIHHYQILIRPLKICLLYITGIFSNGWNFSN